MEQCKAKHRVYVYQGRGEREVVSEVIYLCELPKGHGRDDGGNIAVDAVIHVTHIGDSIVQFK